MRIQHNIAAINAHRQLGGNNDAVAKNLEKLSSGYRINKAGDDAAGLAISEKMRAQIKGLETAQKNAQDGISLVQTAEGNLTEVHSMLNRMVVLATQSANGTYDDSVDRANLQKEVVSLNGEIDRIAKSANFNGIKLLDGSINEAKGVDTSALTVGAATKSGSIGTLGGAAKGDAVDGTLTKGVAETKYSASFYLGDITNSNAAAKDITLTYKDATGTNATLTLTVDAGKSVTTQNIVDAIKKSTTAGVKTGDITAKDGGSSATAANGKGTFSELYDISVSDDNIVTITAKYGAGEKVDGAVAGADAAVKTTVGGNFGIGAVSIAAFDTADKDAAVEELKEKYDGTNTNNIAYGSAAGQGTAYAAEIKGNYQVASTKLALGAGATAANLHNTAIQVGSKTYVFQNGQEAVKGAPAGARIIRLDAATDNTPTKIAEKLAAAISADEPDNDGYVATANAGTLTISESTARARDIYDNGKAATKAVDMASKVELTTSAGTTSGNLTIDASKLGNGTTITVGNDKFMLSSDPNAAVPAGTNLVNFAAGSTSAQIASALATSMTNAGLTGVTDNGNGSITFAATPGVVSATSAGLSLQVGDTSDSYQKVGVKIGSMSTTALGIDRIDIGNQDGASDAINKIKSAINQVSSTRGDLGALQNRLDHTINNLGVTTENMTAAESRIRDVDMAKEMMDFTKNNILTQAAQAMLAQANTLPQGVLQLLR